MVSSDGQPVHIPAPRTFPKSDATWDSERIIGFPFPQGRSQDYGSGDSDEQGAQKNSEVMKCWVRTVNRHRWVSINVLR